MQIIPDFSFWAFLVVCIIIMMIIKCYGIATLLGASTSILVTGCWHKHGWHWLMPPCIVIVIVLIVIVNNTYLSLSMCCALLSALYVDYFIQPHPHHCALEDFQQAVSTSLWLRNFSGIVFATVLLSGSTLKITDKCWCINTPAPLPLIWVVSEMWVLHHSQSFLAGLSSTPLWWLDNTFFIGCFLLPM